MKRAWACGLLFLVCGVGCQTSEGETSGEVEVEHPAIEGSATPPSNGGTVQIQTGGAGGVAPVTGAENVQGAGSGGGGGVGQAAKDAARNAASQGGGSSLDQAESD